MGQGENNARQWLRDHPDVQQELLDKIMARANGIAEEMTTGPADDDDTVGQDSAPVDDME